MSLVIDQNAQKTGICFSMAPNTCSRVSGWSSSAVGQLGYDPPVLPPLHPSVSPEEQTANFGTRHLRPESKTHLPLKKRKVKVSQEFSDNPKEVLRPRAPAIQDLCRPNLSQGSPAGSCVTPVHHNASLEQSNYVPGREGKPLHRSSVSAEPFWTPGHLLYFHLRVHRQQLEERVSGLSKRETHGKGRRSVPSERSVQLAEDDSQSLRVSQETSRSDIENREPIIPPPDGPSGQDTASKATLALASPNQCPHCPASFPSLRQLRRHCKSHESAKGRPHTCEVCSATFAFPNHLRTHLLSHSGEKPFECKDCGRRFTLSRYLERHVRVHTGERPFLCQECGATFAQYANLWHHKRIHTGELPYECLECGKKFRGSSHLKRHVRSHTGEKPYVCPFCSDSFTTWDALHRHKVSAHEKNTKNIVDE